MDYTKLAIFLFIALGSSVVIFGSPTFENDDSGYFPDSKEIEDLVQADPDLHDYPELAPNQMEIEELRARLNASNLTMGTQELQDQTDFISIDQDSKLAKRVDPGTVIAGASLAFNVLQSVLGGLGRSSRKIAIGIDNESQRPWVATNVYFVSGTSDRLLPHTVPSGKALLWGARKSSIFRGSAGVLAYYIPKLRKTLLVMYSVPLSYSWHRNWFNVRLCPGKCRAKKYHFNNLYYRRSPIKGDHSWHYRYLGSRLSFKGSMTSSGRATLQMKVYRV